ncbi:MAG: hypothetical protein Q7K40_03100 [bacterium]|nr:hypothetical protein [bacterium]
MNAINFESIVTFFYHISLNCLDDELGRREFSLSAPFLANSYYDAIIKTKDHAMDRLLNLADKTCPDLRLGCIKVSTYNIGHINNGLISTAHNIPFFEWKSDYPGSLDDYIKTFTNYKCPPWKSRTPVEIYNIKKSTKFTLEYHHNTWSILCTKQSINACKERARAFINYLGLNTDANFRIYDPNNILITIGLYSKFKIKWTKGNLKHKSEQSEIICP